MIMMMNKMKNDIKTTKKKHIKKKDKMKKEKHEDEDKDNRRRDEEETDSKHPRIFRDVSFCTELGAFFDAVTQVS